MSALRARKEGQIVDRVLRCIRMGPSLPADRARSGAHRTIALLAVVVKPDRSSLRETALFRGIKTEFCCNAADDTLRGSHYAGRLVSINPPWPIVE